MRSFFKQLITKIKLFFTGLSSRNRAILTTAISVVDFIYQASKHPITDILTTLTPTGLDDKAVEWLKSYLPDFLKQFKIFAEIVDMNDPQLIIIKVSEILASLNEFDRNGERLKIAVALAIDLTADGKLDWGDAVRIVQSLKDGSITTSVK